MDNADKSAYPQHELDAVTGKVSQVQSRGLSKRERFAMAVLQGFLSAGQIDTPNYQGAMRYKGLAKESIRYADELLRQLEETK